jgi:hypothetical protein
MWRRLRAPRCKRLRVELSGIWGVDRRNPKGSGQLTVKTDKNQELTRHIGRRLREACGRDIDNELPAAIAGGLAALREVELRRMDTSDGSMTGPVALHGATHRE